MPIIENSVCQEMFHTAGHNKKILPSFLCAGYANGQKDSCEVSIKFAVDIVSLVLVRDGCSLAVRLTARNSHAVNAPKLACE